MFTNRQVFRNDIATTRALLRCSSGVNKYNCSRSFFRFRLTELYEFAPRHICYAAVNSFVSTLLHVTNVQVLKCYELIFIYELPAFLVREVVASICLALVTMTKGKHSPFSRCAPLIKPFLFALQSRDILGIALHPSLTGNFVAIRQDSERSKPQVNTNNLIGWREGLWLNDTGKASVPVTYSIAQDCQGFAFTVDWPMKFNFHIANLGQPNAIIVPKSPVTPFPWICKAIVSVKGLKSWVSRLFSSLDATEEGAKSKIKTYHCLLHRLGMTVFEPGKFFLPPRKHFNCIVSSDAFLSLLPRLLACFERLVVHKSTSIKLKLQRCALGRRWKQSKLEGFAHVTIIPFLPYMSNYCMEQTHARNKSFCYAAILAPLSLQESRISREGLDG